MQGPSPKLAALAGRRPCRPRQSDRHHPAACTTQGCRAGGSLPAWRGGVSPVRAAACCGAVVRGRLRRGDERPRRRARSGAGAAARELGGARDGFGPLVRPVGSAAHGSPGASSVPAGLAPVACPPAHGRVARDESAASLAEPSAPRIVRLRRRRSGRGLCNRVFPGMCARRRRASHGERSPSRGGCERAGRRPPRWLGS